MNIPIPRNKELKLKNWVVNCNFLCITLNW